MNAHHVGLLAGKSPGSLDATAQMYQLQGTRKAGAPIELVLYEPLQLCPKLWVLQSIHCWRGEIAANQVLALHRMEKSVSGMAASQTELGV